MVPIESFEMPEVEKDTISLRDRPVVQSVRRQQIEELIGLRSGKRQFMMQVGGEEHPWASVASNWPFRRVSGMPKKCGVPGQGVSARPTALSKRSASPLLSISMLGIRCANIGAVVRFLLVAMCLLPGAAPLSGVTMQQLSMDDLAVKSTAIVRGHVIDTYSVMSGPTVYTHYHVAVTETIKGPNSTTVDVALPGGTASGVRQTYPGVPQLSIGSDYVLYLWTSPTGLTMPTGFSQGIFAVTGSTSANLQISRDATAELMLDASGHPVTDQAVSMRLIDMRAHVASALAKAAATK
jgi:hypothetical protein